MVTCAFIMALYNQSFINGFYKACYYDCNEKNSIWYDRRYVVDPDYYCPMEITIENNKKKK